MISLIVSIFFIFLFTQQKKKGNTFSSVLYFIYSFSFLSSFIMVLIGLDEYQATFIPTIYLVLILLIWFKPFDNIKSVNICSIKEDKAKLLSKLLILILFPAFIYFSIELVRIISNNLGNLATLRNDINNSEQASLLTRNNLTFFYSILVALYFLPLFFCFMAIIKKWNWKYIVLLFCSSLSFILFSLCQFGRDGVVLWVINAITLYYLLYSFFDKQIRKKINRVGIIVLGVFGAALVIISINRFLKNLGNINDNSYLLNGTVGYFAQQHANFCDIFFFDAKHSGELFTGIRYVFSLLGFSSNKLSPNNLLIQAGLEEEINVFSFFPKAFLFAYGKIGALLFAIFMYYIIKKQAIKLSKSNSLYSFIIILFLFQIPLQGVFYFRQSVGYGDLAYIFGIGLSFLCLRCKHSSNY